MPLRCFLKNSPNVAVVSLSRVLKKPENGVVTVQAMMLFDKKLFLPYSLKVFLNSQCSG